MRINDKSAGALILFILGLVVMSPSGQFFCFASAAFFSAIPALFSKKRRRIIAIVLLGITIAAAFPAYIEYKKEMNSYIKHQQNRPQSLKVR